MPVSLFKGTALFYVVLDPLFGRVGVLNDVLNPLFGKIVLFYYVLDPLFGRVGVLNDVLDPLFGKIVLFYESGYIKLLVESELSIGTVIFYCIQFCERQGSVTGSGIYEK